MTFSIRAYREGDQAKLEALLRSTFSSFKQENYWNWKYKTNPGFDPDLVLLAEQEGRIIGCNHWLVRDLQLARDLRVKAVLAADVAVNQAYRGQGIGKELVRYLRTSGTFGDKGIVMSYMFTKPTLNKGLYQPAAGYIRLQTAAVTYKKLFNCNQLKAKFQKMDKTIKSNPEAQKKLEGFKLQATFRLKGAPEFTIKVEPQGVSLDEATPTNPDVIIEGNLPLSATLVSGDVSVGDLAKAWLTGKIKIKKGPWNIFKLRKAFKIFQAASK